MIGKKARHYINKHICNCKNNTTFFNTLNWVKQEDAYKAIEIAKEEVKEKAIINYKKLCAYQSFGKCHRICKTYDSSCTDECNYLQEFIDKLK